MRKTTRILGAAILALSVASCNNNPTNNSNNTSQETAQPTMQANVSPTPDTPHHSSTVTTNSDAQPKQPVAAQAGQPAPGIPNFKFYKVKSGISYEKPDLPKDRKTMFILFDPGCSHCRTEANAIGKSYDKFKDVNLLFISMNDPALMASFLETFAKELVGKPNVEVLYDRNQDFIQKFHMPTQFPANYIYDKNGTLESYWDGPRDINFVASAINK